MIRQPKLGVAGCAGGFIPAEIGSVFIKQVDPGTGHSHTGAPGLDFDQALTDGQRWILRPEILGPELMSQIIDPNAIALILSLIHI